jgi:hypothetical protein
MLQSAMKFALPPLHATPEGLTRRVPLTKFVSRTLPNFDSRAHHTDLLETVVDAS